MKSSRFTVEHPSLIDIPLKYCSLLLCFASFGARFGHEWVCIKLRISISVFDDDEHINCQVKFSDLITEFPGIQQNKCFTLVSRFGVLLHHCLSMESVRLGGPAHGIVMKTVYKTLSGGSGVQGLGGWVGGFRGGEVQGVGV